MKSSIFWFGAAMWVSSAAAANESFKDEFSIAVSLPSILLFDFSPGISAGYRVSQNSWIELEAHLFWRWTYVEPNNLMVYSGQWKHHWGGTSFFSNLGLGYGAGFGRGSAKSFGGTLALGNRWYRDNGFFWGADWVGMYFPFVYLAKDNRAGEQIERRSALRWPNFTIGYAF